MDCRPMFCTVKLEGKQEVSIPIYNNPLFPMELYMNAVCSPDIFMAIYNAKK